MTRPAPCPAVPAATLKDFLDDGFRLPALLRAGAVPDDPDRFAERVDAFLADYDQRCAQAGKQPAAARDAKYAFCALLDEAILASGPPLREAWARAPLQLRLFDDHLAGEGFFRRLEGLRPDPRGNREPLAVFHACLLHGFQGRHRLDGAGEQLRWLTRALGEELLQAAGGRCAFAPRWRHRAPARPRWTAPGPALCGAALAASALGLYLACALSLRARAAELAGPGPRSGSGPESAGDSRQAVRIGQERP
jgi:type VI secretion system protein ImpK